MKMLKTALEDCYIIEPDRFGDDRGYFSHTLFNQILINWVLKE